MKGQLIQVKRNNFTNEKGDTISYCKFIVATPNEDREDCCGFAIDEFTTKYDNYPKLKDLVKSEVNIEFDFDLTFNGLYKRKAIKVNNIIL